MRNDLHVTEIWLKSFLTCKKKRLLIRTDFVLTDLRTEHSTWSFYCAQSMCFVRSIIICMCQRCLLENRRVWDGVKHQNEICGIHWEKERIKLTQMKGKQCDLILFRAWLCYFYITFTFIAWSCCLMSY